MLAMVNPATGDVGINPIVIVLFIICLLIVIGCIIWAVVLNRKNSKIQTTVVTVSDDDEIETELNTVEDIESDTDEL